MRNKICVRVAVKYGAVVLSFILLLTACASAQSGDGLSLMDAIEQSAEKIAAELPKGSRVVIVAFESANDNLSDYIMEELTGSLFDRGIEVADRQNLEYVYKELNLQMSGNVSDESAKSIGKFLAADMVITGQLLDLNGSYRYRTSAISVETAVRASVTRLNVRGDATTRRMVAALANQKTTVKTAKYGVNEKTAPQTAGTFLDRGILFASRGEYKMAIADFTEALKLDPNMAAAYILRARALVASVSNVIKVEANFRDITVLVTRGNVSVENARIYDQAIADLNQAIRLDPNNAVAYYNRGYAYNLKGDYDRAIADLNQAIRLDPNSVEAYISRGYTYYNKKDYDRAITDLNQAIRLDPNNATAYINRGNVYYNKKDYDRAIADYNQAIRLDPNYAVAYINRGSAYSEKGDYDRAIADLNHVIQLDLNNAEAYNSRGYAYYNKKDYDRAIADFDHVIRLDPNFVEAYINRGNAYSEKGDYDRAIADLNQAIRLDPNSVEAYISRGYTYYNKKDYDRAIADFNQAIRLDPNYAIAYNNRGNAYYNKKDYDRAIADYEAAMRINPNYDAARRNLEAARKQRGR